MPAISPSWSLGGWSTGCAGPTASTAGWTNPPPPPSTPPGRSWAMWAAAPTSPTDARPRAPCGRARPRSAPCWTACLNCCGRIGPTAIAIICRRNGWPIPASPPSSIAGMAGWRPSIRRNVTMSAGPGTRPCEAACPSTSSSVSAGMTGSGAGSATGPRRCARRTAP